MDTIRRDSPSHEIGWFDMTRRRRYAPRLVFTHNSKLSKPAGWRKHRQMGRAEQIENRE
ncbi:MAG: hypothetical protein ACI30M_06870 [Muribaculaceae bacterium]